jgi:hypothetical protein
MSSLIVKMKRVRSRAVRVVMTPRGALGTPAGTQLAHRERGG